VRYEPHQSRLFCIVHCAEAFLVTPLCSVTRLWTLYVQGYEHACRYPFVIPAQAGIHPARNALEACSDAAARPWIPGPRSARDDEKSIMSRPGRWNFYLLTRLYSVTCLWALCVLRNNLSSAAGIQAPRHVRVRVAHPQTYPYSRLNRPGDSRGKLAWSRPPTHTPQCVVHWYNV